MDSQLDRIEAITQKTYEGVYGKNGDDGLINLAEDNAGRLDAYEEILMQHDRALFGDKTKTSDMGIVPQFLQMKASFERAEKALWGIAMLLLSGLVKIVFFP